MKTIQLYLALACLATVLTIGSYVVHKIREGVRDDIQIENAEATSAVETVKNDIRNKPINGDYVIDSMQSGNW